MNVVSISTAQPTCSKHVTVVDETSIELSSDDEPDNHTEDSIVSSPYADLAHQLSLKTLTSSIGQFATALTGMRSTRLDYATAPYAECFNWNEIVQRFSKQDSIEKISFFVIVFRSRLKQTADRELLASLDKAAHLEAIEAGGLLRYWFGTPDQDRRNLATCIWRARSDARLGGAGPGHAAAMIAARQMYDEWSVERLKLTVSTRSMSWKFEQWID